MKLLECWDMSQKVKTEKSVHRTLGRKVVTDDKHRFDRLPKAYDQRDGDHWKVFQAAGSDDCNFARGLCRVASYGDRSFYRDNRGDRPGVYGQAKGLASLRALEESVRYEDLGWDRPGRFGHGLKGQGVAGRKMIVRVGDQRQIFISHHRPIDLVPVFAVGQKASPFWKGDGGIHLHNLDQQPLSSESLSDLADQLALHHTLVYHIEWFAEAENGYL